MKTLNKTNQRHVKCKIFLNDIQIKIQDYVIQPDHKVYCNAAGAT